MRGHDTGLDYHRMMLGDLSKMHAYAQAIAEVIQPGDVVLDAGSGTGILAMLAARAGASRVHAVESMPVAELSRELINTNRLSGVIEVHRADLLTLEPIEPVDRVIGDWIGRYLVDDDMMDAVQAASRWLRPGGTLHPENVELLLAPVGDFPVPMVEGFDSTLYGLDFRPARARALHSCYHARLGPEQLLGPARSLVDWRCSEPFPGVIATLEFEITQPGLLKGLAGWFDARLSPSVLLSSSPAHDTHWSQYLFPLKPREVQPGERFELEVGWDGEHWCWGEQRSDWTAVSTPFAPAECVDPAVESDRGTAAFRRGDFIRAEGHYARATQALPGATADPAPIWENLGLARMNRGKFHAAARAFLLACASSDRPQSLRYGVVCLIQAGRPRDAQRLLDRYRAALGPHPDID